MATFPLIFPSLSRFPSMDSSKTIEDDTIRDQMESGYVATRPRFTRARRTWKMNVRNLVAEDVRALDQFAMVTAARGGNSFLWPNLLPNGSFEFPALSASDLVLDWNAPALAQEAITASASLVEDGTTAIRFATIAGQTVPPNTTVTGAVACDLTTPCSAGEVYLFTAAIDAIQGTLAAGVLGAAVSIAFYASNGSLLSTLAGTAATIGGGWQTYGYQFTVPANATSFRISLQTTLTNSTGTAITLDASASVSWDTVACALQTPLTPYGRMAGSEPLGALVRFSKLPEFSDIGMGGGVKRYGANFELTEV